MLNMLNSVNDRNHAGCDCRAFQTDVTFHIIEHSEAARYAISPSLDYFAILVQKCACELSHAKYEECVCQ